MGIVQQKAVFLPVSFLLVFTYTPYKSIVYIYLVGYILGRALFNSGLKTKIG